MSKIQFDSIMLFRFYRATTASMHVARYTMPRVRVPSKRLNPPSRNESRNYSTLMTHTVVLVKIQ